MGRYNVSKETQCATIIETPNSYPEINSLVASNILTDRDLTKCKCVENTQQQKTIPANQTMTHHVHFYELIHV